MIPQHLPRTSNYATISVLVLNRLQPNSRQHPQQRVMWWKINISAGFVMEITYLKSGGRNIRMEQLYLKHEVNTPARVWTLV